MKTILIANNHIDTGSQLEKFLNRKSFRTQRVSSGKECLNRLKHNDISLVLSGCALDDMRGLDLLKKVKDQYPHINIILTAEKGNIREAAKACRTGAYDYIPAPIIPDELLSTIAQALKTNGKSCEALEKNTHNFVKGESPQFHSIQKSIQLVAETELSVIITGDTGTGKEYVAREIHRMSSKKEGPFKAVDCGTLANELAGSELFGHVKGAFTGAIEDKKGCFELANHGTLFLDEIGNLSAENQVKLLRVLQDREVTKIGATKGVKVDVRLLAASNENLREMVEKGSFRKDLFYRLNEFEIVVPPLKERPADIRVFALHFLQEANKQLNKCVLGFDDIAMERLLHYQWPGNLRELKNVVKRMVLTSDAKTIQLADLPPQLKSGFNPATSEIQVEFCNGMPSSLHAIVEEVEQQTIIKTLEKTGYNKAETSRILHIDRKTLYNKMKAYGISY